RSIAACVAIATAISLTAATPKVAICPSAKPAENKAVNEYLDFLYSSMTLADSLDYSRDFYAENIKWALKARKEMPWGKLVPEREFRHFVLPVRVNNEHLDSARQVFYRELAPRISHLSMTDAALEVNHWLHEKATYRPSDSRTSPPLATVKTAFGRCGEESTLAVAAMRSVGIPARQIYTPRWAHTDDNHAWVEVWIDGSWHFLGACEPEPILDLAWFNAPASRGMLMNTNTLGSYYGDEEVLSRNRINACINVTSNYAPVDTAHVRITDATGRAVKGATVRFCLYNYAEFYPIATKTTNDAGIATLTAGLGDLVVWATDGTRFGVAKYTVGSSGTLDVALDKDASYEGVLEFNLTPPRQSANLPAPTAAQAEINKCRFAAEDSIRSAYTSTFTSKEESQRFAASLALGDDASLLLANAYGNHRVIRNFLTAARNKRLAALYLLSLSEKDLRDITPEILADSYTEHLPAGVDTADYVQRVMSPRIFNETLTPYRAFFARNIGKKQRARYAAHPDEWVKWISKHITTAQPEGTKTVHISPESVYRHRKDIYPRSRDIFAVASLRSFGVQAWLDPVNLRPHYIAPDGKDVAIDFASTPGKSASKSKVAQGSLILDYSKTGRLDDPGYYYHFTLSDIKNGAPSLLNYADDATWSREFKNGTPTDAGQKMLVSGQRIADGTVLARAVIFRVDENEKHHESLVMRQDTSLVQVIGNFNSENRYFDIATGSVKSILSTTGRGYYVIALIKPNHEPSAHILNDMAPLLTEIGQCGVKVLLLFADADEASRFNAADYPSMPGNVVLGTDVNGVIAGEMGNFGSDRPVVLIADTFNRVVMASEGYTIGLWHTILSTLSKL
ncbi:MAG: transglutaminase domain-containing protein, partial [Muribaculaceae bacterium]